MKVKLDIDVTPEELRTFLGLPDVAPLQEELLHKLRDRILDNAESLDPLQLLKPILGDSLEPFSAWQKACWKIIKGINTINEKSEDKAAPPSSDTNS